MQNNLSITLIGTLAGIIGTGLGGFIAAYFGDIPKRTIGFMLQLSAGIMLIIVCLELIPEAVKIKGITTTFIGFVIGVIALMAIDSFIKRLDIVKKTMAKHSMIKTGILIAIGISLHNFPEGLAVGSGLEVSAALGYNIALVIALHDIPEGISVALPLLVAGVSKFNVFSLVILSGLPTGLGALLGAIVGDISPSIIALCLSIAAGAMIYIVLNELIPQARNFCRGKLFWTGFFVGAILGTVITFLE
jgi:ZIP family zinc transporter